MKKTKDKSEFSIVVEDIPRDGLFLNYSQLERGMAQFDPDKSMLRGSGRLELFRQGKDVQIKGELDALIALPCDRCLVSFEQEVATDFFYLLRPSSEFIAENPGELQVTEENVDEYWYEDGIIRADDLFREQILLKLPVRNLCSRECKGLCPGCGADLNREECRCEAKEPEGPFAVLKGVVVKE